jgi:hypothetical protein
MTLSVRRPYSFDDTMINECEAFDGIRVGRRIYRIVSCSFYIVYHLFLLFSLALFKDAFNLTYDVVLHDSIMNWKACGRKQSWLNLSHCHGIILEELRKTTKLCLDNRPLNRDLNPKPSQYEVPAYHSAATVCHLHIKFHSPVSQEWSTLTPDHFSVAAGFQTETGTFHDLNHLRNEKLPIMNSLVKRAYKIYFLINMDLMTTIAIFICFM